MADTKAADATRDQGPGVKFPPPLVFVVGFALGALLTRVLPLGMPWTRSTLTLGVGGGLLMIGVIVALTGVITFRRARVAVYPNRPASELVTHGLFRVSRNPMYLGMIIAYVGGVVVTGIMWALVLLPLVLVVLYATVIRREERHLHERFPDAYAAYCREVRRWL
jgi:protein-S-isoprenylcysteine O-methyltransferase Ste14